MKLSYIQSLYYSGQGIVYAGVYSALGVVGRLVPLGNASALSVATDATYFEPMHSRNGVLVPADPQLLTFNATFRATLESISGVNLAWVLGNQHATPDVPPAGAKEVKGYPGRGHLIGRTAGALSAVTMPGGSVLTEFTDDYTPWDYRYFPESGMLLLNDGAVFGMVGLVEDSTARVTATMVQLDDTRARLTVADTSDLEIGSRVLLYHAAGGLGGLTAYAAPILSWTDTEVDIAYARGSAPGSNLYVIFDGFLLGYTAQVGIAVDQVGARIDRSIKSFLRFAGLNTADGSAPYVVDILCAKVKPENGIDWLNRDVSSMEIAGPLLPVNGEYFRQYAPV
jgi:hypothetical protein